MKLSSGKLALCFLGWSVFICFCYGGAVAPQQPKQASASSVEPQPIVTSDKDPNIVARISDYVITKQELQSRLMNELRGESGRYSDLAEPVSVETVLKKLIAEKAMIIESAKQGYREDKEVQAAVERFKRNRLVQVLLTGYVQKNLTITDAEVQAKLKDDPKLDPARARAAVQQAKVNQILEKYFSELCTKFSVNKINANFAKAAEIHKRLLENPKEPRKVGWILLSQVESDMTPEERNIVLATYQGGKVTLEDWFNALNQISPPSRPKELSTPEGVGNLLDMAISAPIFASEAVSLGLDKNEEIIKQIKNYEDIWLLGKIQMSKVEKVDEPNETQVVEYFNSNKEAFGTPRQLKIDQIWFENGESARKAKAQIDAGKDFDLVKKEFSLEKESQPFVTDLSMERIFFKQLWQAEPNEVVVPIKGIYMSMQSALPGRGTQSIKWRIVKILEKIPAELNEYSDQAGQQAKQMLMDEMRFEILDKYGKELLDKYPYEIYADRIKDMDPLDIP